MPKTVMLGKVVGDDAKINGVNNLTLHADSGIKYTQSGNSAVIEPDLSIVQKKITGEPNQVAGFDADGNVVPVPAGYELYGFELNMDESYGPNMIRYIAQNAGFTKAGLTGNVFSYGDWANAWFIKNLRPCVLKFDGTVAYDLNPNNFKQKKDGSAIDQDEVANIGNVMIGLPTVWVKVDTSSPRKPKFYFSNLPLDGSYHAYAHHDDNDNIMPYTYLPAYNGWVDGSGRLRSISDKTPTATQNGQVQITDARANNPSGVTCWDIEKFVDRQLINLLLLLIGKTTDTQTAFGRGNENGYNTPAAGAISGILNTGTMDNKGLFAGYISTNNLAVKVFGMENYWGNLWRRTLGLVASDGLYYYKLTKSTADGSTVIGFNVSDIAANSTGAKEKWIKGPSVGLQHYTWDYWGDMYVSDWGLIGNGSGGSSSSKYYDKGFADATSNGPFVARFGGDQNSVSSAGAFCYSVGYLLSSSFYNVGAALSCKPNV